ncbi:MAG: hypothetical protein GYA87_07800 [Christensenellaceae bacterium]|nr:hypothetical protein [Christensenellaceae bacterium]
MNIGVENTSVYIIFMVLSGFISLCLAYKSGIKFNLNIKQMWATLLLMPLFVLFFSHLLYCLVDIEMVIYDNSFWYIFAFWNSGHMVFGGILGAIICILIISKKQAALFFEAFTPSIAIMVAFTRIAEGFLGQGYGEYWEGETGCLTRFPFMIYDIDNELWAWAIFVLEALVALCIFIFLIKKAKTWNGDSILLFLGLYSSAQVILESLRRDDFLRWGFVRIEQLFAAICVLIVLIFYGIKAGKGNFIKKSLGFSVFLITVVSFILLEFALEGRVSFLLFLDVSSCYILMAIASIIMGAAVLYMRNICNKTLKG